MYPHLVGKDYQAVEHNHRVSFILHPFPPDTPARACMKTVFDLVWSHELRDLKWIFDAVETFWRLSEDLFFKTMAANSLLGASLLILWCFSFLWQEVSPFNSQGWRRHIELTFDVRRAQKDAKRVNHTPFSMTKPLCGMSINANPVFNTFYSQPSNTLFLCYTKKFLNIREINLQVFKFYAKLPIPPDPMVICQPFDCLFPSRESRVSLLESVVGKSKLLKFFSLGIF